jgi:hypothetical protein
LFPSWNVNPKFPIPERGVPLLSVILPCRDIVFGESAKIMLYKTSVTKNDVVMSKSFFINLLKN